MTPRQAAYQEFLASVFWADIREECFKRDGGKCRHCGDKRRLQAHHVLYPADWYQTTLDHLLTLCKRCHEKTHGIEKPKKEKPAKAIEAKEPKSTRDLMGPIQLKCGKDCMILRRLNRLDRKTFRALRKQFSRGYKILNPPLEDSRITRNESGKLVWK